MRAALGGRLRCASFWPLALLAAPTLAQGVEATRGAGVADRSRPEYDALGLRVGGFTAFPAVATQLAYDSNVLRTQAGREGDALLTLRPRVQLRSNWSRHALSVLAEGEVRRFADLHSENSEQVRAGVDGRLDATRDIRITASAGAARLIEPRGSAGDALLTAEPIAYRQLTGAVQATAEFGRASLRIGGTVARFRYDDAVFGGVRTPLDYRDYRRVSGTVRAGYAIGPAIAVYAQATANRSTYPDEAQVVDRGSDGVELLGGIAFSATDLLTGEIGVGYLRQSFGNPDFADVSGLGYQASLSWNPTPLTSVAAEASRDVERAPFVGVGGVVNTELRLSVDHELLRQLILTAAVEHVRDRYAEIARTDRRNSGEIGARYLISRTLSLNAAASYRRQRSSGTLQRDYAETVIRFGLTVQR